MKLNALKARRIGDILLVVDPATGFCGRLDLNETALALVDALQEERDENALATLLQERYPIDAALAHQAVTYVVNMLDSVGVLVRQEAAQTASV